MPANVCLQCESSTFPVTLTMWDIHRLCRGLAKGAFQSPRGEGCSLAPLLPDASYQWCKSKISKFNTQTGEKSLPDLFDGRKQLIMLSPGDETGFVGCSFCLHGSRSRSLSSPEQRHDLVAIVKGSLEQATERVKECMG